MSRCTCGVRIGGWHSPNCGVYAIEALAKVEPVDGLRESIAQAVMGDRDDMNDCLKVADRIIAEVRRAVPAVNADAVWRDLKDSPEGVEVLVYSVENNHPFYDLGFREGDTWTASWTPRILEHPVFWMSVPKPPAAPAVNADAVIEAYQLIYPLTQGKAVDDLWKDAARDWCKAQQDAALGAKESEG